MTRIHLFVVTVALFVAGVVAPVVSDAAGDGPPEGGWIASSDTIEFFRVARPLDLGGLVNGFTCSEPTGYDRGRVRADCRIKRNTEDFRARLDGRFKLDLRHKSDGTRIVVRIKLKGFLTETGGRRTDVSITIKGRTTVEPGRRVAVIPLITKACTGSVCEKGHVVLPLPLESADGSWALELTLDPTTDRTISGSAELRFADALVLSWDVAGRFNPAKDRSKLVLIPNQPVRDRSLAIVKLVPTADGFVGRLVYSLFGQSGRTSLVLERAP